jgi:uncharacterized iron-regulated protein
MSPRVLGAAALALLAAACARRTDPRLVAQPIAGRTWVSPLHRDHPLVGRIWDGRAGAFTDEAALGAAVAGADLLLLGEVHDNADHHLLQARLVRAAISAGRRPALALEMLAADQQAAVDAALARSPRDPRALDEAWMAGGWRDLDLYRPVLAAGLEAGLPVVAANLPRPAVRALVSKGIEAAEEPLRTRLAGEEGLPPGAVEELRAEMRDSHCGELPETLIDPLILAQRARDATLSARMAAADQGRGAILVAGKGHVRTDRGVPAWLARDAPGRRVLAVAFVEVDPDARTPAEHVEGSGRGRFPFDYAVFTPAAEREDPCERLRARSRERQDQTAAPGAPAPPAAPGAATPRDD